MYFGVPSVFGNMIGGVVYHKYGGVVLFQGGAILAGLWFTLMVVCFHVLAVCNPKVMQFKYNISCNKYLPTHGLLNLDGHHIH